MSTVKIDLKEFQKVFEPKLIHPCPLCGERGWSVPDVMYELREYNFGDLVIGGNMGIIPVIPLVCNNCGNTVLINAVHLGLMSNTIDKK